MTVLSKANAALLHADIRMKFGRKGADREMVRAKALVIQAGGDLDGALAHLEANRDQLWAEIKAKSELSTDELTSIIEDDDYRKLARVIEALSALKLGFAIVFDKFHCNPDRAYARVCARVWQ